MPATVAAAGAVAYSVASGTSVTPAYPAGGIAADEGLVLIVGQKPSTANGGTTTTPSGWTLLGQITGAGGYSTTLGVDTGNTNLRCFIRIADGSESGSVTVTVGQNNVAWAQIIKLTHAAGEAWDDATVTTGSDTTGGNAVSALMAAVTFAPNDLCLWAFCSPSDASGTSEYSAHQISAVSAGIGFSGATEIAEASTGNGNDIGGYTAYASVTSGTASGAATIAAVSVTGTNARGPMLLVRVHVATLPQSRAGDFMQFFDPAAL